MEEYKKVLEMMDIIIKTDEKTRGMKKENAIDKLTNELNSDLKRLNGISEKEDIKSGFPAIKKTIEIKATFGWFGKDTDTKLLTKEDKDKVCIDQFNAWIQNFQSIAYEKTGVYVAFQTHKVDCNYLYDWGCPTVGEPCIMVSAIANPEFIKDLDLWKGTALNIIKSMKKWLDQSTVTVTISYPNMMYFNDAY